MAKMTLQQRYEHGLKLLGFERDVNARSSKYHVWIKPGWPRKVFVGKAGSLRVGTAASKSYSSDRMKVEVLAAVDNEPITVDDLLSCD